MPDIDVRRAHHLGHKAARATADKLAEDLGERFGLRGDWQGNVLHFERPGVTGTLAVNDKDLHLSVSLGFLLKAMKGSIERAIEEKLDALLPAKPKKAPARPKKGG